MAAMAIDFTLSPELEHIRLRVRTFVDEVVRPGEAKIELENCLKREDLGSRIVGVETADKMTDHQIAAKVRDHYLR